MLEIKVEYSLGEIVENRFTEAKYMVIGYNYIEGDQLTYICLQTGKEELAYIYGCNLKGGAEKVVGFIH